VLYYYAYTGHKIGLDRAKRGSAVIKALAEAGVDVELLVNDFRAGVAMKEHGIDRYVTIETVQDIDAVASIGDVVIIDSPEDHKGRLEKYCSEYKEVFRFAEHEQDRVCYDEIIIKAFCEEKSCINAAIVDNIYFEMVEKEERILFFFGDADYDKTVLQHKEFFKDIEMEMLLGHYFFVKYEDELAECSKILHEPETYMDLIRSSSIVVTASGQTAIEAKVSGARVVYLDIEKEPLYPVKLLQSYGIGVVKGFNAAGVKETLASDEPAASKRIEKFDISKIVSSYQ